MSAVKPILQAKGLLKRYGTVVAMRGADFELYPGEILGVIGDNGAGKSTLFRLILGEHLPSSGTILFGGEDITGLKPFQRIRRGMFLARWGGDEFALLFPPSMTQADATVFLHELIGELDDVAPAPTGGRRGLREGLSEGEQIGATEHDDLAAQQVGNVGPRRRADFLDAAAALAQHDGLLAVALDEDDLAALEVAGGRGLG